MKTYGINAVSIIVNKFVTQIVSNTERTKRGISLFNIEHTVSCSQVYGKSAQIYVIATNTRSAISPAVFSK